MAKITPHITMSRPQLQVMCIEAGLSKHGTKEEMVRRLKEGGNSPDIRRSGRERTPTKAKYAVGLNVGSTPGSTNSTRKRREKSPSSAPLQHYQSRRKTKSAVKGAVEGVNSSEKEKSNGRPRSRSGSRKRSQKSAKDPRDDDSLFNPKLGRIPQPVRFSLGGSICNAFILLYQAIVRTFFPQLSKPTVFFFCVATSNPLVFTFNMNVIYGWKKGQTWHGAFLRIVPVSITCALLGTFVTDMLMRYTNINEIWSFLGWAGVGNVEMITMAACGVANFLLTKMMLTLGKKKSD